MSAMGHLQNVTDGVTLNFRRGREPFVDDSKFPSSEDDDLHPCPSEGGWRGRASCISKAILHLQ